MRNSVSPPELAQAYALMEAGQLQELEYYTRRLIQRYPDSGPAWQLYGVSFLMRGRATEAVAPLKRACGLMPAQAAVWDNLGVAYFRAGECLAAERCFQGSLALSPNTPETWVNASANAFMLGRHEEAERCARRALQLKPGFAEAYLNLANAQTGLRQNAEAIRNYRHALELNPAQVDAYLSMGGALERMGDVDQAAASYRQAIAMNPDYFDAWSNLLFIRAHDEFADPAEVFEEHRAFGSRLEATRRTKWRPHTNEPDPDRRLSVGFVSGDLRKHAVAYFIEPLWKEFDRDQVAVYAYSNHPVEDDFTARLKTYTEGWAKVFAMSDEALAERIRDDGIDILVDCSGHTAYNRLPVFASKPAPVQVSWLGYPGTTGLSAIDYRPISKFAASPGKLDAFFTEKLVYVPCATSAFEPSKEAPEVNLLPAMQNGYVTFATFNRPSKLGDRVIELWSRVLNALPASRLLIGSVDDDELRVNLGGRFRRHGITTERLDFHPRLPMAKYLALHHEIDIILDTFPYSGGTTSHHALWMGVPVLTLAGGPLSQRQGAHILARSGLQDWVVETEDDYMQRALSAASDLDSLAALRASLRDRISQQPYRSTASATRCLESVFRAMWRHWCAGLPPQQFDLQP